MLTLAPAGARVRCSLQRSLVSLLSRRAVLVQMCFRVDLGSGLVGCSQPPVRDWRLRCGRGPGHAHRFPLLLGLGPCPSPCLCRPRSHK